MSIVPSGTYSSSRFFSPGVLAAHQFVSCPSVWLPSYMWYWCCARTFCKFRTFENHISSYHRGELHSTNQVSETSSPTFSVNGDESSEASSRSESSGSLELRHAKEIPQSVILQRSSAMFLLHMKEGHKLTQAALLGILEGVTSFCQQRLSSIRRAVNTVLTDAGITTTSISGLDSIFHSEGPFGQPFDGLGPKIHQGTFSFCGTLCL